MSKPTDTAPAGADSAGAGGGDNAQSEVIAFLSSPAAYAEPPAHVDRYETHGAIVFAAGGEVYKIKRAVRFPYMDFSTLARREAVIRREFALNAPAAPGLYLGVVPIVRAKGGGLAIGGSGPAVEWALHMRRFADGDLLSAIAARGGVDRNLAIAVADAVLAAHARSPVARVDAAAARFRRVVEQVTDGLAAESHVLAASDVERFRIAGAAHLDRLGALLDGRAAAGRVRRCHGDLHAGNIVLWRGRPVLFDALEFDDELATVDTLYDLAFLLMDLDRSGARAAACVVLDRYLLASDDRAGIEGLAALPLFLAVRAAVRALVGAERAAQEEGERRAADMGRARQTLAHALAYLVPPLPILVAVGGFSGTGKSTLAAALAPAIGAAPGALHIRADIERKALFGVSETDRLPPERYTPAAAETVYKAMFEKAGRALAAGHSVVVDAVFSRPGERAAVEAAARQSGAAFHGIWLSAPPAVMLDRVARREGDASDATPAIAERQLARGAGTIGWSVVDAGGSAAETTAAALRVLGIGNGGSGAAATGKEDHR